MDGIKVNHISVNVDKDKTKISLYKTNKLVGFFYGEDIGMGELSEYDVSLKAYQNYIRDLVINLLDNGGIDGYYYEQKADASIVKYNGETFIKKMQEYINDIIGKKYQFMLFKDYNMETEMYKDGYIKNAIAKMRLILKNENIEMKIVCIIRSGQACRPKTIEFKGEEYPFNITAVNKLVKNCKNGY